MQMNVVGVAAPAMFHLIAPDPDWRNEVGCPIFAAAPPARRRHPDTAGASLATALRAPAA
jgi:hypothetical protein